MLVHFLPILDLCSQIPNIDKMKIIRITLLFTFCLSTLVLNAQKSPHPLSGEWPGYVDIPGMKIEMVFEFLENDGIWTGNMDIPAQGAKDMALSDLKVWGDSLSFVLPEVPGNANFKGAIDATGEALTGDFKQAGFSFPMYLTKKSAAEKAAAIAKLNADIEKLIALADSFRILRHHPGLAFGIVKDDKVLFAQGFGYRDLENKIPVTANTLFAIGSSSKAFTAMGAAISVEEGKLEWDKPIINYLPDFELKDEFATKEMTMVDLLTHRSGLPRHDMIWYATHFNREEIYHRMKYLEPNKSFRTTWQYQNLMFMTAGYLIGQINGVSWEEFTKKRIFDPLKMNSSNFSVIDMQKTNDFAFPYQIKDKTKVEKMEFKNIDAVGPAGSINSSITDMMKWASFLSHSPLPSEKSLIKNETRHYLFSPHMPIPGGAGAQKEFSFPSYGLGWMTYDYDGTTIVEHGGNIDGFSALVWLIPEHNIGMVALTNVNGSGLNGVLCRTATSMLLDKEPVDWFDRAYSLNNAQDEEDEEEKKEKEEKAKRPRVEGTNPAHSIHTYIGTYEHPGYGQIKIVLEEDKLKLKYYDMTMELEHWHYETFNAKFELLEIENLVSFQTDEKAKVVSLTSSMDPSVANILFTKLPSAHQTDPDYLAKLVGDYELEAQKMNISLRDKKVILQITGQPTYELLPYQDNEYKLKDLSGFSVDFIFNTDKTKTVEMKFIQPNGIFVAKRK